ncbi:MAG: aspartate-semialdehyde dehydrogenase [Candidatus Cloacimonetes bacterium]|nr:aspartate-semialdehyde dehydrogenase [Candidatus Cloacimonadota bacterium]
MKIGIVGATGEVGQMMLKNLEEFGVEIDELRVFASARSAGKQVLFKQKNIIVEELSQEFMEEKFDYLLFSAGSAISKIYVPYAVEAGNTVIDNSSAFRGDYKIPLVVPEINGELLNDYQGIVANPNCSTIQIAIALHTLGLQNNIARVVITTLQSVSGSGHQGISTLEKQRKGSLDLGNYPKQIDLNVIPQIGDFAEDGYCEEEQKLKNEMRRLLASPKLEIVASVTRVPVIYGHSASVFVEFAEEVDLQSLKDALSAADAIQFDEEYTTPLDLQESNDSHVSRLRYAFDKKSIQFWNVAHNVRLGAATNAVKIMLYMAGLKDKISSDYSSK